MSTESTQNHANHADYHQKEGTLLRSNSKRAEKNKQHIETFYLLWTETHGHLYNFLPELIHHARLSGSRRIYNAR